jgi:hypothetical protein
VTPPVTDPQAIRRASVEELTRMRLPLPPAGFPLLWEPGDGIELRPRHEIEERVAILNVVLARCFGMSAEAAVIWLDEAYLTDQLTMPERQFVVDDEGDKRIFSLHLDALFALAWVLGIAMDLDPMRPSADGLVERLPNLLELESFPDWRSRMLSAPRSPDEVAAVLDLYYCLDWAYLEAERHELPLPGPLNSNAIGQRRWALEWAVLFTGPFHDPPAGWEEIDLSA